MHSNHAPFYLPLTPSLQRRGDWRKITHSETRRPNFINGWVK